MCTFINTSVLDSSSMDQHYVVLKLSPEPKLSELQRIPQPEYPSTQDVKIQEQNKLHKSNPLTHLTKVTFFYTYKFTVESEPWQQIINWIKN